MYTVETKAWATRTDYILFYRVGLSMISLNLEWLEINFMISSAIVRPSTSLSPAVASPKFNSTVTRSRAKSDRLEWARCLSFARQHTPPASSMLFVYFGFGELKPHLLIYDLSRCGIRKQTTTTNQHDLSAEDWYHAHPNDGCSSGRVRILRGVKCFAIESNDPKPIDQIMWYDIMQYQRLCTRSPRCSSR